MEFSFDVGTSENHKVYFYFDRFSGKFKIEIDGHMQIGDFRTYSFKLTKVYEFPVGTEEQHQVRIEKKRKLLMAPFRKLIIASI